MWQGKLHGEAASVNSVTETKWYVNLAALCSSYNDCDIFNADKTGLFADEKLPLSVIGKSKNLGWNNLGAIIKLRE